MGKGKIYYAGLFMLFILCVSQIACSRKEPRGELKRIWYNGSYIRDLTDFHEAHMKAATKIETKPATHR